jgi:hypothetical protein
MISFARTVAVPAVALVAGLAMISTFAATAPAAAASHAADAGSANLTGLPSYEIAPHGLMINGLLPAPSWEG